jgi:RimJ/RimL family protein N-acetyltransferase
MKIKFEETIVGQHILLKKLELDDAPDVFKWRSSISGRYLRQPAGYSLKSQEDWIKNRGLNEINYIIIDKTTKKKVGTIGIYDVNDFDRIANVGRLLVNEDYLGKSSPYGLEALLICYNFVFNIFDFRKITGDILATNTAMYKLQKFLGMKQEGYLEKHTFINDNFEDLHIMSIFKEEFNNTYAKKINFLLKAFK